MRRPGVCVVAIVVAFAVGSSAAHAVTLAVTQVSIPPPQAPSAHGQAVFELSVVVTNTARTAARNVRITESLLGTQISKVSHTSNVATTCGVTPPEAGYNIGRRCVIGQLGAGKSWSLTFSVTAAATAKLFGYAGVRGTIAKVVDTASAAGLAQGTIPPPTTQTNGYWAGYWTWFPDSQIWVWTWVWETYAPGWIAY
jgi:hypothetical protein